MTEKAEILKLKRNIPESLSNIAETAIDVGEEKVYSLLAGYTDKDGITHNTFTLREMTGADEEYVNRSDIKSNGAKVSTALLARCVTSIGTLTRKSVGGPKEWEDIIKHIYVGDRDVMLLELRRLSIGEEIEVTHTCPNPDVRQNLIQ